MPTPTSILNLKPVVPTKDQLAAGTTVHNPNIPTNANTNTGPLSTTIPTPNAGQSTAIQNEANAGTLVSQIADTQKQLKAAQAFGYGQNDSIQKDANGNIIQNPANQSKTDNSDNSYPSLVAKALQAGKTAGAYNTETKQEESDVENNPNYTGGLGLGLSGQIERNRGAQGQELLAQAQTATSLANGAAPTVGAQGQTQYSPLGAGNNPQNSNPTLNPLNNVDSIAQQVLSKQISPAMAYALGGNVPNFQGVLNQAIISKNPKVDIGILQGEYDAKQQNTTTSGTAPTNAAADLYKSTYPQLQQLKTTTNNIGQFRNLLLSSMVAPDGTNINPSNVKYANQTIGQIRSQLSSSQQAQFDTTFAQLKAQIASLLSTGGAQIPTQTTQDANAIIDGSAPLGTLNATLRRIATEGNILTSNLEGQLNTAGGAIGAPKVGNNNNPAGI